MTDTPDWADEEMHRLLNIFVGDSLMRPDDTAAALTASLRAAFLRGRIAGLREAAEIGDRNPLIDPEPDDPLLIKAGTVFRTHAPEHAKFLRAAADKLEAGN